MKPARILTLLFLFAAFGAAAQGGRDAIEEQKRVIAALEKRIADEERAISKIQEGRAATEERVRRLARQLDSRNQLLEETEKQARLLLGLLEQLVAGVELACQAANPFLGGGAAFLYLRDRAFLVGNPLFQGSDDPFLLFDGIAAPLRRSAKGGEQEKEGQYAGGLHHGHSFSALPCSMRRVIWSAS